MNVGLVGAGFMGSIHAKIYSELGVEIRGIACLESDRARKLTEEFGGRYLVNDFESLLYDSSIDIIDICTPTYTHREHVIKAAEAGKHIICEKPIGLTIEDADEIIDVTTKAGIKFMVAHCIRFWPEYHIARDIVLGGDLGKPLVVTAKRLSSSPEWHSSDHRKLSPEFSGGAVIDIGIHDLDYLTWVFGPPV